MAQKITDGDKKALIILSALLILFNLYLWFTNSRAATTKPQNEEIHTTIIQDTTTTTNKTNINENDSLTNKTQHTKKETTITTTDRYPGPPQRQQYIKKLTKGATIDLNSADTLLLQRVPGIGATFARRIYKYREQLGGFYVVEQLQEVYGMDRERYDKIKPFMTIKTPVRSIYISPDSIGYHPYLQFRHKDLIRKILLNNQDLTWEILMKSNAFTKEDSLLIAPYLPITLTTSPTPSQKEE